MTGINQGQHRELLRKIAFDVMKESGLLTDFPGGVMDELAKIYGPASDSSPAIRDMTGLLWCSIDNDSSLDLDQLTAAQKEPSGAVKIFVAIADVDAVAGRLSAIDVFASQNTLSVYTPAVVFPMLPVRLSNDLTSLNFGCDRLAVIIEMTIAQDGGLLDSGIYRAKVRNKAKLAYDSTAAWLDNKSPMPVEISRVKGLDENIRLQDATAQKMQALRHAQGALHLVTLQTHPVFADGEIKSLELEIKNRAKDIIEDFMIAANGVTARFLESKKFPSIRRVVHTPKRWDRIISLALEKNFKLPQQPDAKSLDKFLLQQKNADPLHFPDLSLSIIKLLGPGEYTLELPGESTEGHFGLAVRDYEHSTAPNRRYPDLVTQRLLKKAIEGGEVPYSTGELKEIAKHCTEKENDAKKVERHLDKSAAALLLTSMIGLEFDSMVTGASNKGTYVRIFQPPVEGRLSGGLMGLDVGQKVRVKLVSTDVERGFVDFEVKDQVKQIAEKQRENPA